MTTSMDLSGFRVVRLNGELFPITPFEQAAYERFRIVPVAREAAGEAIVHQAARCEALVVVSESLPAAVIDRLEDCRVISRLGAGTDKIDREAATRNGIVMTNVPDFCYEEQADHALALILALARKLPQMERAMRTGEWDSGRAKSRSIRRFSGQVLGMVGFGGSAKALARRARSLGMRLIACRQSIAASDDEARQLGVEMTDLETVVRTSDYLSLHLPLNDRTRGMFDRARIESMQPGAYFINTARGALVDETALAAALRGGRLAGAGLDTFAEIDVHGPDARPPVHPLLELDNVIVTPHVAAFSVEAFMEVGTGGVENLAAVLSGRWPDRQRVVNPEVRPRHALS